MSKEGEQNNSFPLLPPVRMETVTYGNRMIAVDAQNQIKAEIENPILFQFLEEKSLSFGGYLIYIPLMVEVEEKKLKLPEVTQNTINSYGSTLEKFEEIFDLEEKDKKERRIKEIAETLELLTIPGNKLPEEDKVLYSYLEWWCEMLKIQGLKSSEINKLKSGAHFTYELLSKQAETDRFRASFNL